jgi:type I restriction enzyme, R subunit
MAGTPNETYMEEYIVKYLTTQPIIDASGNATADMEYRELPASEYNVPENKEHCILASELIAFLKDTQPKEYQKLVNAKNGDEEAAKRSILDRIDSEMRTKLQKATAANVQTSALIPQGTLSVLRLGEFDAGYGAKFKLLYNRPANNKTPEHDEWYRKNRLAIVRQLRYSKVNDNEIDLVIFVNGFPVVTIELKNTLTGQTHHNAIKQYMTSRQVKGEKFLEFKRCLVHFAVGTEQAFMTTRLDGESTRFFPFNKTYENIGVKSPSGYRTSYIWEEVLRRDSLLDLIQNFMTVQVNSEKKYNAAKRKFEDDISEALIFPRYHQRRAVHRLVNDVVEKGAGHTYLVQHSAGSGKSNTITWLAYRLSNLYQHAADDNALFDCVFVVTDRRVLNTQIRTNVRQFATTDGEVYAIGQGKGVEGHKSSDLKKAIEEKKGRIIITTIQMFPEIADTISIYPDRMYAVIIDEAHSSQSGENNRQMRKALSLQEAAQQDAEDEEENDEEKKLNDMIEAEMKRKGYKSNVSFFAFTATPKPKTIEIFCERENGSKEPFDVYTMEQAIKEGFILDVMKNYMSFKRYYKLVRDEKFDDKEYDKKKSVRLLASYVDLQDAAIERKSRIMVEHFASQTVNEIEGKARAMLVTRSRLHAVRYKQKFDSIMQEMNLPYRALVAFSGTVYDEDTNMEYTETSMNNLEGKVSIPEALKMPKYRILIVANKFQTGFDEPLLHTMFVDKKLGGTSTVQTLSRLNRCKRGKTGTMVLDFVNDPDEVQKDFQTYYGKNLMQEEDETDPNSLYDVKGKLRDFGVFTSADVNEFAKYYFRKKVDKQKVNIVLDEVCDHAITSLPQDMLDKFRKTCLTFTKLYSFLSQIITFQDAELEKLSPFCLALAKKLPFKKEGLPYDVLNESQLESYRVQYISTRNLELENGDTEMKGMHPGESKPSPEDEYDWLSNIIKVLNETFGIDLTDEDKVDLNNLKNTVMNNEELMSFFNPQNSRDDVKSKFDEQVDSELLNFINTKLDLYNKLTEDRANTLFKNTWFNELYDNRVRGMK